MMYLPWGAFYEGQSDSAYYNILLPRIIEQIVLADGTRPVTIPGGPAVQLGTRGRSVEEVAAEICENREAYHIIFIHADTGGRGVERSLDNRSLSYCQAAHELCAWRIDRCIVISPRHETEAWMLADPYAVMTAFGYRGAAADLGLPQNAQEAERIADPKQTLQEAHRIVRGRRASHGISEALPTIARLQSLDLLRMSTSFQVFEGGLRSALRTLGCI